MNKLFNIGIILYVYSYNNGRWTRLSNLSIIINEPQHVHSDEVQRRVRMKHFENIKYICKILKKKKIKIQALKYICIKRAITRHKIESTEWFLCFMCVCNKRDKLQRNLRSTLLFMGKQKMSKIQFLIKRYTIMYSKQNPWVIDRYRLCNSNLNRILRGI